MAGTTTMQGMANAARRHANITQVRRHGDGSVTYWPITAVPASRTVANVVIAAALMALAALWGVLSGIGRNRDLSPAMATTSGLVSLVACGAALWLLIWRLGVGRRWLWRYRSPWAQRLHDFIVMNRYYIKGVDANGHAYVEQSLALAVTVAADGSRLRVTAFRNGDRWNDEACKLGAKLSGALGLTLDQASVNSQRVDYTFPTVEDARLVAASEWRSDCNGLDGVVRLSGWRSWKYDSAPHLLVCGGTGSGKTIFLYWVLGEWMRQRVPGELYIVDPKDSDLGMMGRAVIGEGRTATTPAQAAKVVRLCREEMERRFAALTTGEGARVGDTYRERGYRPVLLVVDELAALRAACSATGKGKGNVWNDEIWPGIVQLVLKGRQAGVLVCCCLQQPRSEDLPTNVRDNLLCQLALGKLSEQGYTMAFGNTSQVFETPEGKGEGYVMTLGMDTPSKYRAPWLDPSEVDVMACLSRFHESAEGRAGRVTAAAR